MSRSGKEVQNQAAKATPAAPAPSAPPAATEAAPPVQLQVAGAFVPKVKKLVTLPTLTMKAGETYYLKFLTAISKSKVVQKDKDGKEQEAAHIAQVVDLPSGEARTLIVNAVLVSVMSEEYKADAYVGKGFMFKVEKPKDGKRYKGFSVAELEL